MNLTSLKQTITSQRTIVLFGGLVLLIVVLVSIFLPRTILEKNKTENLQELTASLPYETSDFVIFSTKTNDGYRYYVREKVAKPENIVLEVNQWFQKQGITDPTKLNIFYLPLPGSLPVKQTF